MRNSMTSSGRRKRKSLNIYMSRFSSSCLRRSCKMKRAARLAANRLKTNFILHRIAEREKIEVTKKDVDVRIKQEAARYDIPPEKMRKELQQKGALDDIAEQILL